MKIFQIAFTDGSSTVILADSFRDARRRCYDKWPVEPVEILRIDIV